MSLDQLSLFSDSEETDAIERDLSWQEQVAERERLTAPEFVRSHVEAAIDAIQAVARDGYTLKLAYSAGKDSTALANITFESLVRMHRAGERTPALIITSANTLIENPEVLHLMHMHHQAARDYGLRMGLDVRIEITEPRLSERWWVGIIGGTALPSFYDTKSDCSTDMKITPMSRLAREIDADLKRRGEKPSVTLIGTRFDESKKRLSSMTRRGDSRTEIRTSAIGGHEALVLSPICDFPTETLWAYLQTSGDGKTFPGYLPDFSSTYSLYDAASGGECVIYVAPGEKKRGGGCGSRFGCMTCVKVESDRSMANLLMLEEYAYLRPMSALRQYLLDTRFDFNRRRWLTRRVDANGEGMGLAPNTYSADECERLLRMVLTIDVREAERAARVRRDLETGRISDDARNRRMAEPQFRNLSAADLLAVDYLWALNALAPPFAALRVAQEVFEGSGELDVPKVKPTPRRPIPAPVPLAGDAARWHAQLGTLDPLASIAGCEGVDDDGFNWRDETAWTIDPESAALFMELEAHRVLEEFAGRGVESCLAAVDYYLRMGIVAYPRRMAYLLDRMKRRAAVLVQSGLAGAAGDGPAVMARLGISQTG